MPMLRSYGGSPLTTRSPKRIRPASGWANPARSRRSVVLPHPEGPSSVNSSPSPMTRSTRSTAVTAANRLTTPSTVIFTTRSLLFQLVPLGLDVGPELRLERLRALGRHVLVV